MARITGTVKWFNDAQRDTASYRVKAGLTSSFTSAPSRVTASSRWPKAIAVEFEIVQGQKGPQAADVTKVCDRARRQRETPRRVAEGVFVNETFMIDAVAR